MDIKFDQSTQDLVLFTDGDGNLDFALTQDASEQLMQRLFLRLKTYTRDLFWDVNYGIDYLNTVFGKNRPKSTVDIVIKNEIMKDSMVKRVVYFESEIINYTYSCTFKVEVVEENVISTFYLLTNENGVILTNENGDRLTASI